MSTIKFQDTNSKQATKSVAKLGARIKDRCPEGKLLSRVEEREEVQRSWEEDCLSCGVSISRLKERHRGRVLTSMNPRKKRAIRRPS
jgi:hypothetical protein